MRLDITAVPNITFIAGFETPDMSHYCMFRPVNEAGEYVNSAVVDADFQDEYRAINAIFTLEDLGIDVAVSGDFWDQEEFYDSDRVAV